jgi:hypothetical protein
MTEYHKRHNKQKLVKNLKYHKINNQTNHAARLFDKIASKFADFYEQLMTVSSVERLFYV